MKRVLCYGDSNTYGCDTRQWATGRLGRYDEDTRWTGRLQKLLGDDYCVIEEGLNGRTTVFDDVTEPGRNGFDYLEIAFKSHDPIYLFVIMLGTNETKERFASSAACVAIGMGRLVKKALATECWGPNKPNVLVIAPPHIGEGMPKSEVGPTMGAGCVEKSRELAYYYKQQCDLIGCHFLDAQELGCEFNNIDCMHLTRKGHETMANALAELIPHLVK